MTPTPYAMDIRCEQLWKTYPGAAAPALQAIDLHIQANEFVVMVGASGCGKSTLLRTMAGLEDYDAGTLTAGGLPVDGPSLTRAMVFQHYSLYPWLTVLDNIRFCRQLKAHTAERTSADVEDAAGRADALLRLMGLTHVAHAYPSQLSGGMQQRVAIARAFIMDPPILLMDEPFGALDEIVRDHLNEELLKLWDSTNKTICFVTHSIPEAVYLSTKIVVMSPRPGCVTDIIESTLPKERPLDIRETPEFLEIAHRVREGLKAGHSYEE